MEKDQENVLQKWNVLKYSLYSEQNAYMSFGLTWVLFVVYIPEVLLQRHVRIIW